MNEEELNKTSDEIHNAFTANNPVTLSTQLPNEINNTSTTINFEPYAIHFPKFSARPESDEYKPGQRPGVLEGIAHEWMNWSGIGQNVRAYQKGQALKPDSNTYDNPSFDPIPEDWTAFQDRDMYLQVSRQYWDLLFQSKSPKDQEARFNYARNQMAKEDYYNRGSIMQKIISKSLGIPGGIVLDPYNLVPIAASMKYLKLSQNFIAGAKAAIPGIAAIEVTKNIINYENDPDMSIKEAGYNTLRDTLAGTFLIGGMAGLGRGYEGYKLYRARQAANLNYEGVAVKFKLGEKGNITGYEASPMPNVILNAAEQTRAQEFLDSTFAKTGLFWLPKATFLFGKLSPVVRGLSSSYGSTRAITNRLIDHDINTVGGNRHVPNSMSFEKRIMNIEGDAATFGIKMEGLRKKYNGIDLTVDEEESLKKLNSALNKKDPYDAASFGRRVASAIITDSKAEGLQINEAKVMWDEFSEKYWTRYQRAMGFREEILPVATAKGYMTQVYNRMQMVADEDGWVKAVSGALKEQDELITSLTRPIEELSEKIKGIREQIINGVNLTENRGELARLTYLKRKERNKLIASLRNNPDHNILLRERNLLTSEEAKGLKKVLKPLTELKKAHKKLRASLSDLKEKNFFLTAEIEKKQKKGMSDESIQKHFAETKKQILENNKEITRIQSEIETHESKILEEQSSLSGRAINEEFPPSYYFRHHQTGFIHFRDPSALPKFRPKFIDEEEMELEAKSLYTSILNLSDEEVMSHQVDNLTGIIKEDPTYSRKVMIPSKVFLDNNFLVTDLPSIAHNYAMGLGRASAMEESLSGLGIAKTGINGAYEVIGKEYQSRLKDINYLSGKAKVKAQEKITKEFNKEKQFVTDLIDAMLGKNHDKKSIRQASAVIRNLAASTRLGFVPLTQVSDMMGNVFKHGIYRFIRDGFAPTLKTLNGKLGTKDAENFRRIASEANLALEHFRGGLVKKFYGHDSYGDLTPTNKASAFLEKAAHISGNLSGTNYIENANQRMTASIVQSKIMELMQRHLDGTLSKKQARELDRIGLDPNIWAKDFINQFNQFGEKGVFGGYQSYYYNWSDPGAKVKMAEGVFNATRNTIIRRGKADLPFFLNNSILSLVTQFMGWGFAAFNRYTIPLLQRADANQIIGTTLMAMVASMEGVTRKLARGEEVDMDNENFFAEAFSQSAPFSMLYKSAMFANQFLDIDFLTNMQNDKQRGIMQLGMIGGPGFGVIKDYAGIIAMMGTQDYNKNDFAKMIRAIPGITHWWSYQMQQKFIDAATEGLPERRGIK